MADVSRPAAENAWRNSTQAVVDLPALLNELVKEHHAVVYRYACRLCGCWAEAEDLTQQTFLIAHQELHQLREADRARAWLLAVVRSCFLKSVRKARPTPAEDIELLADEIRDSGSLVDAINREELSAALDELPEEFRLVLLMF